MARILLTTRHTTNALSCVRPEIPWFTLGFWISLVVVGESLSLGAAADHIINTVAGLLAVLLSWRSFNARAAVTG